MKSRVIKTKDILTWLDKESGFYSRLLEEPVTRRTALRVNAIFALMAMGGIVFENSVCLSVLFLLCSGLLVWRQSKEE